MQLISPSPTWQNILRDSFTDVKNLADFLCWSQSLREKIFQKPKFPFLLPKRLALKIKKNTLDDPILKQFLPCFDEEKAEKGFCKDPVKDLSFQKEDKLLKKYEGRALLVSTSACAMHCRYCFRQNFPYSKEKGFQKELALIKNDPGIEEIILSGGDPLSLSNRVFEELFLSIEQMDSIKRIRIHTRFPIGIPERIDEGLLKIFNRTEKQVYFVVHVNHPQELDEDVLSSLDKVRKRGAVLLNQSVLLKGINDDEDILLRLSMLLVNRGILPYYLHQLDPVSGSSRFFVEASRGKELIQILTTKLSGYAVPRYVAEIPGRFSKTPL